MTSKNTTNYIFLKDFRPELYKLAVKMEEDLLITPISILAYGTRFLEYILYDIARLNHHEVNRESGFVNNIYELIQLDYLEYYLGDLMIKAYFFRNTSIHNTDITKSLKEDRKTAHELNKRLFDIADVYYKNFTNDYEPHQYREPELIEDSHNEISYIVKQDKVFDKCIICGEATKFTKSNFCQDCDNLLNYRDVLAKIVADKGINVLLKRDDFNYPFKDQLIKDLLKRNVLQRIGNDLKIASDNLDELFKLTDEFMEIDEYLSNFIKNPKLSQVSFPDGYPYCEIRHIMDEYQIGKLVELMKHGFSHKKAVEHVGIKQSNLNDWYEDKKSEFIDGFKDELFVEYNELLIDNVFKSINSLSSPKVPQEKLEFWSQYFEGFDENLSESLSNNQKKLFTNLFKRNVSKEKVLNKLNITNEEFNNLRLNDKDFDGKYTEELERRKRLMLVCIDDGLNFIESLEKSKMDLTDFEEAKIDYLNGNDNEFYHKLSQKLMRKYLNLRRILKSTDEICEMLKVDESEVELWRTNGLFEEFQHKYEKIRLSILRNAVSSQKTKEDILNDLEMSENELKEFVRLGIDGDEKYAGFRQYFQEEYYPNLISAFLEEFRKTLNVNLALKNSNLSQNDLKTYLYSNEELYEEFIQIKIDKIVSARINKGKFNNKHLKKLGMSKEEYDQFKHVIEDKVAERQLNFIIKELSNGEIMLTTCKKVNCDIDIAFDWILKGTLGEGQFVELAEVYWQQHLFFIDNINSELREYNISNPSRNKIVSAQMKYDFDFWMKWGLIDRENPELTFEGVKRRIINVLDMNPKGGE